jgi:hypothetical protein
MVTSISSVTFKDTDVFLLKGEHQKNCLLKALKRLNVIYIDVTDKAKRMHNIPLYAFLSRVDFDSAYAVVTESIPDPLIDEGLFSILRNDFDLETPDGGDQMMNKPFKHLIK